MKKSLLTTVLFSAFFSAAAMASWTTNYAQGTTEIGVRGKGNAYLFFSCQEKEDGSIKKVVSYSDPSGKRAWGGNDSVTILAYINGTELQLSNTDFHAGEDNWNYFWDQAPTIRTLKVKVNGLQPATFTVERLKEVAKSADAKGCAY